METLKLGKRLSSLAAWVENGNVLADVGCDHGHLPVWLLKEGRIQAAVATDIHEKPLQKAMECASLHGLSDKMRCVRTDGLQGIELENIDYVVIAGMGGETIADILAQAPGLQNPEKKLLLQPMSKSEELVRWLYRAGFHIEDEKLADEGGELYRLLSVRFGPAPMPPDEVLLAGESLFQKRDPLLKAYLSKLCARAQRARDGMAAAADPEVRKRAEKAAVLLKALEARKERCEKWQQ